MIPDRMDSFYMLITCIFFLDDNSELIVEYSSITIISEFCCWIILDNNDTQLAKQSFSDRFGMDAL